MSRSSRSPVNWHYARNELAQHYIRMFTVADAHAMVMFAPRGAGKSQFMTRDVQPQARNAGLFPVYINLWDDHENPAQCLIYAIQRAAQEAGLLDKFVGAVKRMRMDMDLEVNLGVIRLSGKPSMERDRLGGEAAEHVGGRSEFLEMRRAADALHKLTGQKLLFIVDEVQTLASKSEHAAFVRSFRSMLDERRSFLKSIFTGSSQARLTELFDRIQAPLYNFAQNVQLPELGDPFLRQWSRNIESIMGTSIALPEMRRAFEIAGKNPRIMWDAVQSMLMCNSHDIVGFASAAAQSVEENAGLRQRVAALSDLDRLVLWEIVVAGIASRDDPHVGAPMPKIFSAAAREKVSSGLCQDGQTPGVTANQVQSSLRRLMSTEVQLVVSKQRGVYELDDPFFLDWMHETLSHDSAVQRLRSTSHGHDDPDDPDYDPGEGGQGGSPAMAERPRMRA